jgi:hypothetical protein
MTAHSRNNKSNNSNKSNNAATVAADPATVATADTAAVAGPRFALAWGTAGRPDSSRAATVAVAFDMLAYAVARIPAPKSPTVPRGVSPRVAAAIRADHAAELAAYNLLRTAVANGRRVNK